MNNQVSEISQMGPVFSRYSAWQAKWSGAAETCTDGNISPTDWSESGKCYLLRGVLITDGD